MEILFTVGSVYFEYASILWNLASRYSLMGVSEDRKSPEGLKTAAKYLQFAAGIIAYTKDKIAPKIKGALFSNMTENALNFALYLMLAQAQACFYLKAVTDRDSGSTAVTPSIIAKIASQSSLFYKRALELSRQPPLDTSLDESWHQVLQLSSKNFEGYAELYQSIAAKAIALKTGSGYGEEIARLRKSQRLLSEVINAVSKLGPSLAAIGDEPKRTLPKIASALSVAEKDNSVVYLDRVPDEGGLSPVGAVVMVKAVDPLGSLPTPSKPLFQNVLSRGASFILAAYKSRVQELLSLITAESNQGTNQANSILSDVGLPGSLDAYKTQARSSLTTSEYNFLQF